MAALPISILKEMLSDRGQSVHGTKSELILKLTLRQINEDNIRAGKLRFVDMTVPELRELKTSLGVKGTAKKKSDLIELLENCLMYNE